jgi:hypothetical protein
MSLSEKKNRFRSEIAKPVPYIYTVVLKKVDPDIKCIINNLIIFGRDISKFRLG